MVTIPEAFMIRDAVADNIITAAVGLVAIDTILTMEI